jgi:hypothetical protein
MRIISRFRDYYDGLASYDKDDKPLYLRETRQVPRETIPGFPTLPKHMPSPPLTGDVWWFCVGICGKLFYGYRSEWKVYWSVPEVLDDIENLTFFPPCDPNRDSRLGEDPWSNKNRRELRDRYKKFRRNDEKRTRRYKSATHWSGRFYFSQAGWEAFQEKLTAVPTVKDEAFIAADAPILYWEDGNSGSGWGDRMTVIVNPDLSELGLTGVMDVYTIAQEIEMYLGNQLAKQEDPASAWSNEGAIQAHGFDDHSFRNIPPGERKERRRANRKKKRNA